MIVLNENLLKESIEIDLLKNYKPSYDYFLKIKDFINTFNFSGRIPNEYKTEYSFFKKIKDIVDEIGSNTPERFINKFIYISIQNVIKYILYSDSFKIENVINLLQGKKDSNIIKLDNITYYNDSIMSINNFKLKVKELHTFLNTLRGFHKKAIIVKPLNIYFVKKEDSKTIGVYKVDKDRILIRADKIKMSDNSYGSLNYILVHELGHRFNNFYNININFDNQDWWTTKYSKKDNFLSNLTESFAELFALSHFNYKGNDAYGNNYANYIDKINKFNDIMKKYS